MKTKYFDTDVNKCKPTVYRRLSGYCAPEMFVDPAGLYIEDRGDMLWVRNRNMVESNQMYADVIAVVPVSQVLSLYECLQQMLKAHGLLNDENEIKERLEEDNSGDPDGDTFQKYGLRL